VIKSHIRRRIIFAVVVIAAISSTILYIGWYSNLLIVKNIEIRGANEVPVQLISETAQVSLNTQLLRVPTTTVVERLKTITQIGRAEVRRGWPSTLVIEISERTPIALTDIPEGCSLDDLKDLNNILLKSGAAIFEMNCIRKHVSKVKGGLLAKTAYPSRVLSLILSDVIGDPIDVIASGPTVHDPSTYADAISIINKYNIKNEIPIQIYQLLEDGVNNKRQETLKESDEALELTSNLIIGTNKLALKIAKQKAALFGYETKIITDKLEGNIMDVAKYIMDSIKNTKKENIHEKTCLLFAGETTIKVEGEGLGGRNQHLALLISKLLKDEPGITFLSAGTDGTDGPTDAAGAVVDSFTSQTASDFQLNMNQYINNCDSYRFFQEVGGLVKTGPTQTNVMDLMVVLISRQ